MADLVVYFPNHGFSTNDQVYVSWLDSIRFIKDLGQDAFKLAFESAGSVYEQHSSPVTEGFVRVEGGDAVTSISNLTYLEGENVQLTTSGTYQGAYTVASGAITTTGIVRNYNVGLPYTSTLKPMKPDIDSTGSGVTKGVNRLLVSLHDTVGGEIGTTSYENIPTGSSLFTGVLEMNMPGGYSRAGDITVRQTEPLPMTVLSLTLDMGASRD